MPSEVSDDAGAQTLRSRLATVVAIDVVGYSRLISDDPGATVAELKAARAIATTHAETHGGRIADFAGDAVIAVFDTPMGAVFAAVAIQTDMAARAETRPENRRMLLRMGVHSGDILEQEDGSVYGDAVNIAARLEGLAPTGGVTVSQEVQALVAAQSELRFVDQGDYDVKNINRPIRVFLVAQDGGARSLGLSLKASKRITKGNLPALPVDLVGRADAIRRVGELLGSARLVTLFGMGGMGKTRLSVELARRAAPDFPDGAWFADLAAVSDPAAVATAVAGVFSVTQQSGKSIEQALVDSLKGQRLLLILDNCEHVTAASAKLADALLRDCPSVKIIATSREALSIGGEHIWPLAPLETTGAAAPAVQLFVERAQAVSPGFRAGTFSAEIAEICRELDGIPLAIELAAARCRTLSPRQILDRLGQRFRLLTGGSRAVRERHQTLLHAVQWSFDLLTDGERQVLLRATAFAGGFTLEAAESVCAGGDLDAFDVCDIIDSLARKSLVTVAGDGGGARYGMLETIRTFGAEKLAGSPEEHDLRRSHGLFYAAEADRNFALWRSPRQSEAHAWLDAEINNLRNAFRWAVEQDEVDIAARIASSVGDMGRFRLVEEAANWAEEIVDRARATRHPRLAILLTWCASSAWAFQRFDDAKRFGEEALTLLEDPAFEPFVWAYGDLAFVAIFAGDIDRAVALLATGAAHPADRHDRMMMSFHLYILAIVGRTEEARQIADDVTRMVEDAGVPMSMAIAHAGKGAALESIDDAAALAAYEHGVEIARLSGARFMETLIAPRIAAMHARSGEPGDALLGFERMLRSFGNATDIAAVSAWRAALIVLFAKIGLFQAAATLHGTLSDLIDAGGVTPEHAEAVERVRNALGARVFQMAAARGGAMSLREVSNYAVVQVQLAIMAQRRHIAV